MPIDNRGGYAQYSMHLHAGVANGGMGNGPCVPWLSVIHDRLSRSEGDRIMLPEKPGLGFAMKMGAVRE